MKRAVVFDLDGTLIHTLPDIVGNLNRLRQHFGFPPMPSVDVQPFIGKGAEYLIRHTFPNATTEVKVSEIIAKYVEYNTQMPHMGGYLYAGVVETLAELRKRGFKLAIATNKPTEAALRTLRAYLPDTEFDWIAGPERVSAKKPNAAHLLEVLAKIDVHPEDAFYVGDDPVDLQTATAANVKFFGAGWGFGGVKTEDDRVFERFAQLLDRIK